METAYTIMVKELFQQYYKRNISVEEYRSQRSKIIHELDVAMNGEQSVDLDDVNSDTFIKNINS